MTRTLITVVALASLTAACSKKPAQVNTPQPPPVLAGDGATPSATTARGETSLPVPAEPRGLAGDGVNAKPLDAPDGLNGTNSPFKPVLFQLDSAELDDTARAVASANADILRKNASWVVTIEGHCDERGSAEYNLALGEQRASAIRAYLLSLGIPANRVRTVSYGKEYPFDPGHTEAAWAQNRRGQFVITSR